MPYLLLVVLAPVARPRPDPDEVVLVEYRHPRIGDAAVSVRVEIDKHPRWAGGVVVVGYVHLPIQFLPRWNDLAQSLRDLVAEDLVDGMGHPEHAGHCFL